MAYDKEQVSAEFERGKTMLNRGEYDQAIELFTKLIETVEPEIDQDEDAKVTWDTALTNRGAAKCRKAYEGGDKILYEAGLEDYRTTLNAAPEEEKERRTANAYIRAGEEELKNFNSIKKASFRFFDKAGE